MNIQEIELEIQKLKELKESLLWIELDNKFTELKKDKNSITSLDLRNEANALLKLADELELFIIDNKMDNQTAYSKKIDEIKKELKSDDYKEIIKKYKIKL